MYSGKTKYITINGLLTAVILLLFGSAAFASETEPANGLESRVVIAQEHCERDGLLISGPNRLDERIRDIIVFNHLKNLDDYAAWLKDNIKYAKDKNGDTWSPAEETLRRGKGDCEDFAFLNAAVLNACGYKPRVIALMSIYGCHAVCIFKEGRTYSLLDNSRLVRTACTSMVELSRYFFSNYLCQTICSVEFADKSVKILYKNQSNSKSITS